MNHAYQPVSSSDAQSATDTWRSGDITAKPTLLRITSDLFLSKRYHSADETMQFQEIALHLIEGVESATLLPIAIKLSQHLDTPKAVVSALLKRGGKVAEGVFTHASSIDRSLLLDTAKWGELRLVMAIAQRPIFDDSLVRLLCERPEEEVALTLLENPATSFDPSTAAYLLRRARKNPMLAQAMAARSDLTLDMTPLFLWAPAKIRAEIILAARRMDLGERFSHHVSPEETAEHLRLERMALSRQTPGFEQELARQLGCDPDVIDLVMQDEAGESLAIVLAAIGIKPDMAARILMMVDPAIAHSSERITSLTELVTVLPRMTAKKLATNILCLPQANPSAALAHALPNTFASRPQAANQAAPAGLSLQEQLLRKFSA